VGNIFYDVSNADFTITGSPTSVREVGANPGELAITGLSPNPAAGPLQIQYSVPRDGHVRLIVLDVQGRVVATLVDRVVPAGQHQATWTGATARGRLPGVYFPRIEGAGATAVRWTAIVQ
jgi:hypothetical protein